MRAFVLAVIVTVVLATGAAYVLESIQETTEMANATSSTRVSPN
jgi:hypothetical protein